MPAAGKCPRCMMAEMVLRASGVSSFSGRVTNMAVVVSSAGGVVSSAGGVVENVTSLLSVVMASACGYALTVSASSACVIPHCLDLSE